MAGQIIKVKKIARFGATKRYGTSRRDQLTLDPRRPAFLINTENLERYLFSRLFLQRRELRINISDLLRDSLICRDLLCHDERHQITEIVIDISSQSWH